MGLLNITLLCFQSTDEGDGIVPSTPTLLTRRHDDGYHAISSPRIPPQQQFRFRFEDESGSQNFSAVPGGLLFTLMISWNNFSETKFAVDYCSGILSS